MNIDIMNVYGFLGNAVLECEYEIATIIGKADRIIPSYISYFKNSTKCDDECHTQKQQQSESIVAINTKRLGLSWHQQNMHKRKCFSHKNFILNENLNSCLSKDQRLVTPRIPITSSQHTQVDIQCFFSYLECCPVQYKSNTSSHFRSFISDNGKASNITAFNEEKPKSIVNGYDGNKFFCAKSLNRWRHRKLRTTSYSSTLYCAWVLMARSYFQQQTCKIIQLLIIILLTLTQYPGLTYGFLVSKVPAIGLNFTQFNFQNSSDLLQYNKTLNSSGSNHNNKEFNLGHDGERNTYLSGGKSLVITSSTEGGGAYLEKLDNLERSLAAVLIKVAYGTTSTTKRSIPENSYVPSLTTIATPILTTLRYQDKSHQTQTNVHHRNYELDLERDHALPTSAPNADILKSNSNPTYPNPNRHHDRDRHRHLINSTPLPSLPNILKKSNVQLPTIPMFPGGDIPSYSPPARSFFTPPLPPEYQHPFADKPTLRGTNNDGSVVPNTGSYINRRPIPPPSLMPGHERIPLRPPDLVGATHNIGIGLSPASMPSVSGITTYPVNPLTTTNFHMDVTPKKASKTPTNTIFTGDLYANVFNVNSSIYSPLSGGIYIGGTNNSLNYSNNPDVRKEVLPSIRRILSGSNGRKGDIPEVLLKQVTTRPNNYHHPPSSPVVLIDSSLMSQNEGLVDSADSKQNINKNKNMRELENNDENSKITAKPLTEDNFGTYNTTSTPSVAAATGSEKTNTETTPVVTPTTVSSSNLDFSPSASKNDGASSSSTSSVSSSTSSSNLASVSTHVTWSLAWNIHIYLSVILFTILAVYSFYKIITYNKLTHLFSQSYFFCIHLILIIICITRTFYLCYDAYNIHSSFHVFISEILLNLPATFLTITFAVLILFLSLKSLNHKHNRYSALIRPLTVVVGCGVHVVLCITLHYVESYTLQNHQQHLYHQQQQQLFTKRQQIQQQNLHYNNLQNQHSYAAANVMGLETMAFSSSISSEHAANFHPQGFATSIASMPPSPPRVLSLICQIIYIFVCFSLGLLYLYLYRILKRILRSKSQNYIHGYQNLSYSIHITIATAMLFVLLAALQIFGAISISSTRPLYTQKTAEIDWLQWGYQFSLRLIEIAIITLISWVAGLKTSNGSNTVNINLTNNEVRGQVNGNNLMFNTNLSVNNMREKHNVQNSQYNHSNMTNFFLPCTSSSSQEQFDTDYPAVCNANTNLHTYTMRTGKLIYDDSFALNSLNTNNAAAGSLCNDFHHSHQPQYHKQQQHQGTYQKPYDSQSLHSSSHHNASEYGSRINYQPENHLQYNDFITENTTDHYENPNFDLRGSGSATSGSALVVNSNFSNGGNIQKFSKTSISNSTTASSSNNSNMESNSSSGSSATSQQQMLLLQGGGETCYSEPIHESYDFNNFEKPKFKPQQHAQENWPDAHIHTLQSKREEKKLLTTLERCGYNKPERRSSNSAHSCNSNTNTTNGGGSGGGSRYASFNTFEKTPFKNVRKSDTLNNITTNGLNIMHGRDNSATMETSASSGGPRNNIPLDVETIAFTEKRSIRNLRTCESSKVLPNLSRSAIERSSINHTQRSKNIQQLHQPHEQHHYSDEDDDDKDDDIMLTVSPHQV